MEHKLPIHHIVAAFALAAGTARAGLVTVDGSFISFTSYIGSDRISYVNGTALTSSGVVVGTNRTLSDPVLLTAETTQVDFNYDRSVVQFLVNSFQYNAPAPQNNVNVGDTIQLGDFTFTNGQWWEQADIVFRLTTHSSDAALNNHSFLGTVRLVSVSSTTFPIDPYAEADYFYIIERTMMGSGRVFDLCCQPPGNPGNVGTFAITGMIGSLIPTGFEALNAGGFTDPSVLPPLQGATAPEPGTISLLSTGASLLLAGLIARKKVCR